MSKIFRALAGSSKLTRSLQVVIAIILVSSAIKFVMMTGCVSGRCRASLHSFQDRLAALERTDSRLVLYSESRPIATGFQQARGIALDANGNIYVAGDTGIRVFRPDGTRSREISLAEQPFCVSVAPDGTVYVAMKDRIESLDRKDKPAASWSIPSSKAYLTSICATTKDVWVGDAGDRAVLRYTPTGTATGIFGIKNAATRAPGLILPSPYLGVSATADGGVWISDAGRYQLELYGSDGSFERSWGKASFGIDGFSGCCNPTDFALLPDGRFVTSEKGLPRVKIYRADGTFDCVVAGREAFTPDVVGLAVAVDARGRILVLDPSTRSVRVFVPKGKANK